MADYIVGDIQACYQSLRHLLKEVNFNSDKDKLWAVGDLIGRGPEALKTLNFLMDLEDNFDCVLGNHDLHFLAISQGIKPDKLSNRFSAILNARHLDSIVDWLRHKPLAHKIKKGLLISHAGLYPGWSIKKALTLSDEVTQQLQSGHWHQLLQNMYANHPTSWSDDLTGMDRTRFIINAMTRMRFIAENKQLDLQVKSPVEMAPKNLTPWFLHPALKLKAHQQIFFGHWAALRGIADHPQVHALDTGCVYGNHLTLIKLSNLKRYSVKGKE
ncbi:symmetrical bis(5'-nucleosyl)-tetraphosphatase [Alteromonadaceae bacterium BrNp21-10]|nr:symmetrical bis(5'-nucleosyl)-tetraphosphatase [Alteromonadaceae bacterium BrNp21-10]